MPADAYLHQRGEGGVFYLNMRVPADVAVAFGAAKVLVSLKTKNRAEARKRRNLKLGELETAFNELRRTGKAEEALAQKAARKDISKLSRAELERLVTGYYRDVLRPAAISLPVDGEDRDELVAGWNDTLSHVADRRDEEGNERVQSTADHILLKAGWPSIRTKVGAIRRHLPTVDVDRTAEQYVALMDLVRRASEEGSRLALAKLTGAKFTPSDPLFARQFDLAEANDKLGPSLSEALAAWKEGSGVRGSRKPRELTAMEAASAVKRFTELHGDIRIGEITKKRVQEFATSIAALPARLPKKLAKLALPELLREDLSKFPPRAPGTINKAFQLLSAIVEDARKRSELEEATSWLNHFPSARVEEDDEDRERDPFDGADLKRIFIEAPVHGLGERQHGGQGEAQYWLPLLALFTGARLSELGQLRVCDVQTDGGSVAFLDIGTSGGRTVKTRASIRKVPLHTELRLMGFLAYVERVKASAGAEATLWPLLKSAEGRSRTAAFSQWFGNYLRRKPISITDKKKVFHGFRHLFKDMCREAGLSEDVHDALTGHAAGKSVGRAYGSGHSVGRLYAEISKIRPAISLTHLHIVRHRSRPPKQA